MHIVKAKNVADAYTGMADTLLQHGVKVGNTTEIQNIQIEIEDPMHNTYVPNRDKRLKFGLPVDYVLGELLWSGHGDNRLSFIKPFSSFWSHLSEDGLTVNSAYGYIATRKFGFNQIDAIIHELKVHPNSRRATLNINVPRTPGTPSITDTKDEWCTMYLEFSLRNGQVDMSARMRSNDVWLGYPYDYTYFLYIQWLIAQGLGVRVGKYVHSADSFHVYDNHFEDLKDQIVQVGETYKDYTIDFDRFEEVKDDMYALFQPEELRDRFEFVSHNQDPDVTLPERGSKEYEKALGKFAKKDILNRSLENGLVHAVNPEAEDKKVEQSINFTPGNFDYDSSKY